MPTPRRNTRSHRPSAPPRPDQSLPAQPAPDPDTAAACAAPRAASPSHAATDSLDPYRNPVEAALDLRLPALLADPEVPAADLARLLTAYAHLHRSQTARLKLLLSNGAPPAAQSAPAAPSSTPQPSAPDAAPQVAPPPNELTTHAGRPAPRRLTGYHPDAPFGRTPAGRPYTVGEFRAALRTAILANWGVDLPDDDPPDDAIGRGPPRSDPDAPPGADAADDSTVPAARSHAADAAERQAPM